jgi:hypothetical protein
VTSGSCLVVDENAGTCTSGADGSQIRRMSRRQRRFHDLGAEMVTDRPRKFRIPIIKALADVYI